MLLIQNFITSILTLIFLLIAILHLYWAFGGKWGAQKVVPTKVTGEKLFVPSAGSCVFVTFGLLVMALLVLMFEEFLPNMLPVRLLNAGIWIIAAIFIIRAVGDFKYVVFFKSVKATRFSIDDTRYFSPLCLFIGILCIMLVLIK